MALQGNLRDFPITKLLNLVHLAHKTGMLEVKDSKDTYRFWFQGGRLAYSCNGQAGANLIEILYQRGKLNIGQARALKNRFEPLSDKALGLNLLNASHLSQNDIFAALELEYRDKVRRIFSWTEGDFIFDDTQLPPEDKICVRANLNDMILESSIRLQEAEGFEAEIPDLDIELKFVENPGSSARKLNLSPQEWNLVELINPQTTIRQIGKALQLTDMDIRKTVHGLLQAGIVDFVSEATETRSPIPDIAQQSLTVEPLSEKQSLFTRLLAHFRSV